MRILNRFHQLGWQNMYMCMNISANHQYEQICTWHSSISAICVVDGNPIGKFRFCKNHGNVQTLHSFMLQLMLYVLWCDNADLMVWLGLGKHCVLAWNSCFAHHKNSWRCWEVSLKTPRFFSRNAAGDSRTSPPKYLLFVAAKYGHKLSQYPGKNIQWFHVYKWWNTVLNCSHWLGSLLVPHQHRPLHLLMLTWYDEFEHTWFFAETLHANLLYWWLGWYKLTSSQEVEGMVVWQLVDMTLMYLNQVNQIMIFSQPSPSGFYT